MATREMAPRLHRVLPMVRWAVAILAVGVLSGCGMGVDDFPPPDGEVATGSDGQALEGDSPALKGGESPANSAPSSPKDPGTVALPQDPIPLFEGKPLAPGGPLPNGMQPVDVTTQPAPVLPPR